MGDEVLVFYWNHGGADLAESLQYEQHRWPVSVLPVSPDFAARFIRRPLERNVVGCVLLLDPSALNSPALPEVVATSLTSLSRHPEFRLFVYLLGMSREEFTREAEHRPFLRDLLDTVNLPDNVGSPTCDEVAEAVERHLRSLPGIRDRVRFERIRAFGFQLSQGASVIVMVGFGAAFAFLGFRREEALSGPWATWILFVVGHVTSMSVTCLLTLGSSLRSGRWLRVGLATFPAFVISTIPNHVLLLHWRYLLAGLLFGWILDTLQRQWAAHARRTFRLRTADGRGWKPVVGIPSWRVWTTAPMFAANANVFISYSRASAWGQQVARELHRHLNELRVPNFLDVEGIAAGTSWRDKVERVLGEATVFVAVQDEVTAVRVWPGAELDSATSSQDYCGLPAIIVLRHEGLAATDVPVRHQPWLFPKGECDPDFVRVIDATPDTAKYLAESLAQHSAFCLLGRNLGSLLQFATGIPRVLLAAIGSIGAGAGTLLAILWAIWKWTGGDPGAWLDARGLGFLTAILVAYWLGFVGRLTLSARFELKHANAPGVYKVHGLSLLAMTWILLQLLQPFHGLRLVYSIIVCLLGLLIASNFVLTTLPTAGQYRQRPD